MSGHVFHPGHHELHGITVLVRGHQGELLVGRFDSETPEGYRIMAVSRFDPAQDRSESDYLHRIKQFGIRVDLPRVVIPQKEVASLTPLGDLLQTN